MKLQRLTGAFPSRAKGGSAKMALLAALAIIVTSNAAASEASNQFWPKEWRRTNHVWRGVHVMVSDDRNAESLKAAFPRLAKLGVNAVIAEINYHFEFDNHPELRDSKFLSKSEAHKLAAAAHEQGIRLIPQLSCLGHQSWAKTTFPLLSKYPGFDETPGKFPGNEGIYCRSWCPRNPKVNGVVFSLIDEIIDAFDADAFHVGMDEVFLIGSEYCPRCKGADPAKLFAKAVDDLHKHIVGKRKVEMLMWGDRLLDAKRLGYGKWESAENGTQEAINLIPKDIIICDWHYEKRDSYPSVPLLLEKGFRVWPAGWKYVEAAKALIDFSEQTHSQRMIGYLATTWGAVSLSDLADWPALIGPMKQLDRQ